MTPEERAEKRRQKILARSQNNPIIGNDESLNNTDQQGINSNMTFQDSNIENSINESDSLLNNSTEKKTAEKIDVITKYKKLKAAEQRKFENRRIGFIITFILAILTALNLKGYLVEGDKESNQILDMLSNQIPPQYQFLLKWGEQLSKQGSNLSYVADEICGYILFTILISSVL